MSRYKLLPLITGLFTATLLLSNIFDNKLFSLFGLVLPAGIVLFPLAYLMGDVLTEVYGYAASRSVIWTGLISLTLMLISVQIVMHLTPADGWTGQPAFESVFGRLPRIVAASMAAYFCGEFVNSFIVAKVKIAMGGRKMAVRFILSTIGGQFVDTTIFVLIAFTGVYPASALLTITLSAWAVKVGWEVIALPITLVVVRTIKRIESEDFYDTDTRFSPFALSTSGKLEASR